MSEQNDKPRKRVRTGPGGSGTGRSGSARSIGEELGGLDFEPDALLDSLLADDEPPHETAPPPAEPPAERAAGKVASSPRPPDSPRIAELEPPPTPGGRKLLEPEQRLYSPDEVTLVGEARDGELLVKNRPPSMTSVDELIAGADPEPPAPPPAPRKLAPPRPPPTIPRPGAPPRPAPRPPTPPAPLFGTPTLDDEFDDDVFAPLDGGTLDDATLDGVPPEDLDDSEFEEIGDALQSARNTLADDDIAYGRESIAEIATAPAERDSLSFEDDETRIAPRPTFSEPPSPAEDLDREVDAMLGVAPPLDLDVPSQPMRPSPLPPPPESDAELEAAEADADWEPADLEALEAVEAEQPAAAELAARGLLEEWIARAEWLESEAQSMADPHARARALVVASELWAMTGDVARAREVMIEVGAAAASMPVVGRQVRQLAAAEGDYRAVVSVLETEARASTTIEARAHAAYLSAEVQRLLLDDDAGAQKKLELVARTAPGDPRSHVARLAAQLGASAAAPKMRWPEGPGLDSLIGAWNEIVRLRGGPAAPEEAPTALARFDEAARALAAGDSARAGQAIEALAAVEGIEAGATWLAAALLATQAATRGRSIALLRDLITREPSARAERALAARAIEQADQAAVAALLSRPSDAFSAADRVGLAALTGSGRELIEPWLTQVASSSDERPLAAAAASIASAPDAVPEVLAGSEESRTAIALGRSLLGLAGDESAFRMAREAYAIAHPGAPLVRMLALEVALAERSAERVARALAEWTGRDDPEAERDRHLAAATVHSLARDEQAAARELEQALEVDPGSEAAARSLLASVAPERAVELLVNLAEAAPDPTARALWLTEAALRLGQEGGDRHRELLEQASDSLPSLPLAQRLAEQFARQRGDVDALLAGLRARRETSTDPLEGALDMVREALLIAETDLELAASLLGDATLARPHDVALRELHERLAAGASSARGAWREELAADVEGKDKARLLSEAALEYERAGDQEAAARAAEAALEAGASELARIVAERAGSHGSSATRLTERLFAQAREEQDPVKQRELYERLSLLDAARGDESSALLWHSAILERTPDYLPALRHLEHAYIGSGRDEELEPIAMALAKQLDRGEVNAHARLAARLRIRAGNWAAAREPVDLAYRQEHPSLWALRAESAHARIAGDDQTQLDADRQLSERANRAIDAATLALRAAEAASRLGQMADAKELLDRAVEMLPEHPVALATLAEVLDVSGDGRGAAEALEAMAGASAVEAHRLQAWHAAGITWLDKADDPERARSALERAAEIDITHEDVFKRLQAVYIAAGARQELAELIERRLAHTQSADERVALEITRGRALAEIGDKSAAKQALAAALDQSPDNADALAAFADLCLSEGDWTGAEQAYIRLARHLTDPAAQAEVYTKLGRLYESELPNPSRAELAYKEVLKRRPDDAPTLERLVHVYGSLGNPQKALEIANQLLETAATPEAKRDRTLALALAHEQVLGDRKKAEAVLDKARRAWPQDSRVLRAVAEFHQRGGETKGLGMLLDRAANDARRALSTGRFDTSFFETLATVAELRGAEDVAAIAQATLAALEGRQAVMSGAGPRAGDPKLDDLLAPDLLGLPLRALLRKAGDALDAAYPLDARALRAEPLGDDHGRLATSIRELAAAFGLSGVEVLVSPAIGSVCLPASSTPARVIVGKALADSGDEHVCMFAVVRALKILQGRGAALSRLAPIELWPTMAAFLSLFAPNWQPAGVDPKRMNDARAKLAPAMPRHVDDDAAALALEVIGSIGNRASQLAIAVGQWGDRTGLLAIGDPTVAIRGIALSGGHAQPPSDGPDRVKWIVRNPEARDLAIFSVSDQYAEARRRLGLSG